MANLPKVKLFGPNARILIFPASLVTVLAVLVIIGVQFGYTKISSQLVKLNEASRAEEQLDSKVEILREFQKGVLEKTDELAVALPDKNPASWSISQIRALAQDNSLAILSISLARAGASRDSKFTNASLEVELAGNLTDYLSFLDEMKNIAPLSIIRETEFDVANETLEGTVNFNIYWAPFPENLPPLTEPVRQLTEDEEKLLNEIASFKQPEFVELIPGGPSERSDPFN